MKVRVSILVLAVVLGFSSARANLLQNGSFETYAKAPSTWSTPNIVDFYLDIGNTDITGWKVIKGEIDYLAYSAYTWQAADGERLIFPPADCSNLKQYHFLPLRLRFLPMLCICLQLRHVNTRTQDTKFVRIFSRK